MATKEQIDKLRAKLVAWDDAYHNGVEAVPDEEYDRNRDKLAVWSPNDKYFNKVGADTSASNKVALPFKMPSLKKVRIDKGAADWLDKHPGEIAILDKLDGSSALVEQNHKETSLYSRGNGTVGQNITRMLPHIKGIPKNLPDVAVRGELMISVADWNKYKEDYDNPRALANSQVTSTKKFHAAVKDVTFVAHEIVSPKLDWKKARVRLKSLGFKTAETVFFTDPTPKQLEDHLKKRRAVSPYELDGLVLIHLRTGDRISFKVDAPPVQVEAKRVEWNISPNKIWKPKVLLKTPVNIGGVMVKQATGHNARYILEHGIGPGAKIMIVRSGDVIPKVVGVVKKVKPQLPPNFKWDANRVEALADELSDEHTNIVNAKRLINACNALGIPGVKLGVATKLVESGIENITDLLNTSLDELQETDIGNANSIKLDAALKKAKREVTHAALMHASGLWPKGFTTDKFISILDAFPINDLIQRYKTNKRQLRDDIGDIHGLSDTTANVFLKSFAPYIRWVKSLNFRPKKAAPQKMLQSSKFSGREFVFTGIRDEAVKQYILTNGGIVANTVRKSTTDLIIKDENSNSSKTDKAEAQGIKLTTLADFKKRYKL